MLHASAGGIKDWTLLGGVEQESRPGNAQGLFERCRKLVDRGSDFAWLFGERRHHPFSYGGFMAD